MALANFRSVVILTIFNIAMCTSKKYASTEIDVYQHSNILVKHPKSYFIAIKTR